mgnify:CR=1 FL=1
MSQPVETPCSGSGPRVETFTVAAYALFFWGFLFFPTTKSHNNFFYLAILLPSLFLIGKYFHRLKTSKTLILIVAYVVYMVVSCFWSTEFTAKSFLKCSRHAIYVLSFIFISIVVRVSHLEKSNMILRCAVILSSLFIVLSILNWYQSHPLLSRLSDPIGRLDNPIRAGSICGFLSLIALSIVYREKTNYKGFLFLMAFLLNIAFIVLSQSRTPMAAIAPSALILLFTFKEKRYSFLVLAAVILILWAFPAEVYKSLSDRYSYRLDMWHVVSDKIIQQPVFGHGYICDSTYVAGGRNWTHAHNSFLGTLRDGGLVGLGLMLAFLGTGIFQSIKIAKASGSYLHLSLLVFGIIAISFNPDRLINNPEEFWLFFWFPLALIIADSELPISPLAEAKERFIPV